MSPLKFRLFLFKKLPIAFIAGLKLAYLNEHSCGIKVRLSWWNQNPFHSMFWAVQGMAAELSSGVICITSIQNQNVAMSMLVISEKATFLKKAKGLIVFECKDGDLINETIAKAIRSGKGEVVNISSIGKDEAGDVVSEFEFTWSFKIKTQKTPEK